MIKNNLFIVSAVALTLAACAVPTEEPSASQSEALCLAEPSTAVANVAVVDATNTVTDAPVCAAPASTASIEGEPDPIPGDDGADDTLYPSSLEVSSSITTKAATCLPSWCKTSKGLTPYCQQPAYGQPTRKDYYYKLQKYWCQGIKNRQLTVLPPDHWITPDPGDTCEELKEKENRAANCVRSRQSVKDCFVKACQDPDHGDEIRKAIGQKNELNCKLIDEGCF